MPRRALNNDTGTPEWPGDHTEEHRAAALKGWARKKGFTRDTVSRGRRKAAETAPAPTQGIALGRAARTERPHPSAEYGYTSHTLPVARLTLMHELGREQDAAKRTAIRRELRKLGVPSDQIPKEARMSHETPQRKAAETRRQRESLDRYRASYIEENAAKMRDNGQLEDTKPRQKHERKLGVPSDQIPKEARMSHETPQRKAAETRRQRESLDRYRASYIEENAAKMRDNGQLEDTKPRQKHERKPHKRREANQ